MGTEVSLALQRRILARRDVYFLDEYTPLSWNILKCFGSTTINLVGADKFIRHVCSRYDWHVFWVLSGKLLSSIDLSRDIYMYWDGHSKIPKIPKILKKSKKSKKLKKVEKSWERSVCTRVQWVQCVHVLLHPTIVDSSTTAVYTRVYTAVYTRVASYCLFA